MVLSWSGRPPWPIVAKRQEWVLKSDYGCEGEAVVCGPFVKPKDWRVALEMAIGRH